jgi:hypothetical protein
MSQVFAQGAPPAAAPAGTAAGTTAAAPADGPAPVTIEVSADRAAVTVGDPVTLTFRLRHAKDFTIVTFDADRSLQTLTTLDQKEAAPRTLEDGRIEEVRVLSLAAYETGRKEIAPVRVVWRDPSGREGSVATRRVEIEVTSVLTEGQTEPADIKKPAAMPERGVWPWVVLGALLVAAVVALLWWRRRRRRPVEETATPAAPPRPAHEVAYAELERLLTSGLLERGAVKEFYIELAEIVRRYLGARFGVETFERTTGEILEELRGARLPVKPMAMVSELLSACDLVKFAKYRPEQDESRRTVEHAYRLVDETRPSEPAAAPETPAAAAAGGAA